MKALLSICMLVVSSFVCAAEMPAADAPSSGVVKGEVLEVQNVANFTYLRLKTAGGEVWAAVLNSPVRKGDEVTIENPVVMRNFESKALKRTFPEIIFGNLPGAAGQGAGGMGMGGAAMSPHGASGNALGTAYPTIPRAKLETINREETVAKAKGANARTVAEVYQQAAKLKGKTVVVRGKVVKYNPDIMGKNWVHLRDGSGSAADGTDDLLVTTAGALKIKVGQVVTARGVVRTDADFGAGYAYKVLLEDAKVQ